MAKEKMILFVLVLTTVTFWESSGAGAGFQTAFTESGLKYIAEVTQPLLEKELKSVKIPDQSGGGFSVSDIQIKTFTLPDLVPSISASQGVVVTSKGIAVSISARWRFKKAFLSFSGSADLNGNGISLSVSSVLRKGTGGHFQLTNSGCAFNIGSLSVKFHGGASWILNLFRGNIARKIKSVLNDKACIGIRKAIDTQASRIVERLPVIAPIGRIAAIDYSLVDNPTFTSSYISTRHKGEFINRIHGGVAPLQPTTLPPVTSTSRMMYLWLSEYIANTAGYVYSQAGAFRYKLTPENVKIPKEIPYCLTTKCLREIIPELYKKFPDMEVVLETDVTKPPQVAVSSDGIHGTIPGRVTVYVRTNASATPIYAFTLDVMIHSLIKASIAEGMKGTNVTFAAAFLKSDLSLADSAIGSIDISRLQKVINIMSNIFVVFLNDKGKQGFPLPTIEGTSFTNPAIQYGEGYMVISTDFKYSAHYLYRMYAM